MNELQTYDLSNDELLQDSFNYSDNNNYSSGDDDDDNDPSDGNDLQNNNYSSNDHNSQDNYDPSDDNDLQQDSNDDDDLKDYYMQELIQEYDNYDTQEMNNLNNGKFWSMPLILYLNLSLLLTEFQTVDIDNSKLNISEDLAHALWLFEIKVWCNLTDNAFNQIMRASNNSVSIYHIKATLKKLVDIEPQWIDMCVHSCCAYTGQFENRLQCPYCDEPRYHQQKKSRYQFACFSLIKRLKMQYEDPNRADELHYQHIYTSHNGFGEDGKIGDIFDGKCYFDLLKMGYFQDEQLNMILL